MTDTQSVDRICQMDIAGPSKTEDLDEVFLPANNTNPMKRLVVAVFLGFAALLIIGLPKLKGLLKSWVLLKKWGPDGPSADQSGQLEIPDPPKPEYPDRILSSVNKGNPITILIAVILLSFVVLFIIGLANRYNWRPRLCCLMGQQEYITLVTPSQAGSVPTILMVVRRDGHSEVRTLNPDTGAPSSLSNSTVESFAPVPSPIGNQVAYLVQDAEGQTSVVVGAPGEVVTDTISIDTLQDINRPRFELCDYAQAVWSTDGQRIATFVCNKQSKESYLLVTEIGGANEILEKTQDNLDRVRSVVWIGPTRVVYTQNERNLDVVYLLDILNPNQPIRLFGP